MPLAFVLIPLIALFITNVPMGRFGKGLGLPVTVLLALMQIGAAFFLNGEAWQLESSLFGGAVRFAFEADRLSVLLLLSIGIVVLAAAWVGFGSFAKGDDRFRFYNLLILAMIGMNGISLASDLFSLYVFLEITAVSSYVLIAFDREKGGLEGAFKYLVMSAVATFMILSAIALLFLETGDLSLSALTYGIAAAGSKWQVTLAVALLIGGLAVKAGLVPFHGWVPDAYSAAPNAVSVLLAGIVTKTTGVYTLIRVVGSVLGYSYVLDSILVVVGLVTILVGAFAAMGQKDMKRMLAYSSISQVGYIVLALGAASPLGAAAAAFHLFNHAVFKTQLFVNVAAVERQAGTRNMDELGGISQRMPVTGWTSVIAFLSTAGIPPLAGFWSKLLIVLAVWKSGREWAAVVAILASLLTLAYFLIMQRKVFFGKAGENVAAVREAPLWLVLPALALALITVVVGLLFPLLFDTIIIPVAGI